MEYLPTGCAGKTNMPAEFEVRVTAVLVAPEIRVIVAFAITAPVLSAVSPRMRPLLTAVCAIAAPQVNAIKRHPMIGLQKRGMKGFECRMCDRVTEILI
jgi:hypothetical protein